ncbi:transposase [Gottfriedia sp. S16(2024)]|uniref:transposase n=1 Tax=Gottfriedia sp. S16(2024) TaxID=3162883 RepID=UPI003D1A44C7
MGKIRKTYDKEFKLQAIKLYYEEGMGSNSIGKELGIGISIVKRWINHYKREGIQGLEEKRGKATGFNKGRPRIEPLSDTEKIQRLEAENAYLKKLLALKKEMIQKRKP